jgi:hypothetical protein
MYEFTNFLVYRYCKGFFQYLCIRISYLLMYIVPILMRSSKKVPPIFIHPDPLCTDVNGTYPNTMLRKVFPIFMHKDPISTDVYGTTYPNATFQKAFPIFMHWDQISTDVYGTYPFCNISIEPANIYASGSAIY